MHFLTFDTNWLITNADHTVAGNIPIVISEHQLFELGRARQGTQFRVHFFLRRHWDRVGYMPLLGDLAESEFTSATPTPPRDVVQRLGLTTPPPSLDKWLATLPHGPIRSPYGGFKDSYLEQREAWIAAMHARDPNFVEQLRWRWPTREQEIRKPDAAWKHAIEYFPKYKRTKWKERLCQWPDTFAIGRWARIEMWYGIDLVLRQSKKLDPNDYEDKWLAFQASYGGRLASSDSRLRTLMAEVFPHVKLVDTSDILRLT